MLGYAGDDLTRLRAHLHWNTSDLSAFGCFSADKIVPTRKSILSEVIKFDLRFQFKRDVYYSFLRAAKHTQALFQLLQYRGAGEWGHPSFTCSPFITSKVKASAHTGSANQSPSCLLILPEVVCMNGSMSTETIRMACPPGCGGHYPVSACPFHPDQHPRHGFVDVFVGSSDAVWDPQRHVEGEFIHVGFYLGRTCADSDG